MFNIDLRSRALKIKLVVFDIDGVMTDGSMIYDENGLTTAAKTFITILTNSTVLPENNEPENL